MSSMTPLETLARARASEPGLLSADRNLVAEAVNQLAQAGDAASALELMGLTWRVWLTHDQLDVGRALASAALSTPGAESVCPGGSGPCTPMACTRFARGRRSGRDRGTPRHCGSPERQVIREGNAMPSPGWRESLCVKAAMPKWFAWRDWHGVAPANPAIGPPRPRRFTW